MDNPALLLHQNALNGESELITLLLNWHDKHGRHDLPWQATTDPYRIWLSEVQLQQTQVATVIPYYQRFLAEFPTPADLANAPIDKVLQLWAGLGYYRRAHHLYRSAAILAQWQQHYPCDIAFWQSLPGVGRSTAASIVASAFNTPAAILDGNVKRVLSRLILGERDYQSLGKAGINTLWSISEALSHNPTAKKRPRHWNQTLMDMGAIVCKRTPECSACPAFGYCQYARKHLTKKSINITAIKKNKDLTPRKTKPIEALIPITMLIFCRASLSKGPIDTPTPIHVSQDSQEIWLEKRDDKGLWAGLHCPPLIFPEGYPAVSLSFRKSLTLSYPAISKALEKSAKSINALTPFTHQLTHRHFSVLPLVINVDKLIGPLVSKNGQWVRLSEMNNAGIPVIAKKAFVKLMQKVA